MSAHNRYLPSHNLDVARWLRVQYDRTAGPAPSSPSAALPLDDRTRLPAGPAAVPADDNAVPVPFPGRPYEIICLPVNCAAAAERRPEPCSGASFNRPPGEDMKAVAVFPGSREVKIIEQEGPRLSRPDQVMLRMLDIGICGTDKEICSFEYGTPPPGDDHLVIGHESVAEIVQVGSAVERLRAGDLVVPSVRRPCPHPGCLAAIPGIRITATPATSASAASRKHTAT